MIVIMNAYITFTTTTPIKKYIINIQGHVWLRMLHICQNYAFIITSIARLLFKKLKDLSKNAQNRRSQEKANHIYETYKNTVMPHGRHIYAKAYDMAKAKMCANSQLDYVLPHWKCVLRCCAQFPSINIPDQETDDKNPNPNAPSP